MKETLFIVISRGFLVRNILRSGILDLLVLRGYKIVIFIPRIRKINLPQSFRDEFESEQVIIEEVENVKLGRIYRKIFSPIVAFLVYTQTTWTFSLMGNVKNKKRANWRAYLEKWMYKPFSYVTFFKYIARFVEQHVFRNNTYEKYFDKYNPSLVFSSSIVSTVDILFMKEARRRGIKTVSMPKGWDNIAKMFYKFVPDLLVVQNELMEEQVPRVQCFSKSSVVSVGFPQFDYYVDAPLLSREEYCKLIGVDPKRKLIFFGSEGVWAPYDDAIVDILVKWLDEGVYDEDTTIIIRPHYSDVYNNRFVRFENTPHVVLDPFFTLSNFFLDNWDPVRKDMEMFANLLHHSDVLITTTSTLTLDAACFDLPIINIAFGILYKHGQDMSELFYKKDHYQWVLDTGAVDLVFNNKELLSSINKYFGDPSIDQAQRKNLVNKVCYRDDGKSCERIVNSIEKLLAKK